MATSSTPVKLIPRVWLDIYAETGISVGTQLTIQNIGAGETRLSESVVSPISTTGHNVLIEHAYLQSATTPVGVWAYATEGSLLQVESV